MGRFRVLAAVAAAVTIGSMAPPIAVQAAPAAPHRPAPPATAPAHSAAAVQWTRGTDGKASGVVHYPSGLTARIAQRNAAPADRIPALRQATWPAPTPTPPTPTPTPPTPTPAVPTLAAADVPAAEQGTIKGRVSDSQHHPLAGVVVDAYGEDPFEPTASATTNGNGHYSLPLAAGSYFVYFDGSAATGGNSDATGYVGTADEFQVVPAGSVIRNPRLQAGAELRVRVTDRGGNPLAGISPYLKPVFPYVQDPFSSVSISISFSTDDLTGPDGTFTFRGLPSDASLMCFSTFGDRPSGGAHDELGYADRCSRRPIALAPGSSSDFPTVQLSTAPGGAVHGVVTTNAGQPVANAEVSADNRRRRGGYARTGSDGSYQISGLSAGSYRVCASTDTYPPSATGLGHAPGCHGGEVQVQRDHAVSADVVLHRGGAITGTVTGPTGAPVAGVVVFTSGVGLDGGIAITDGDGNYRVNGLGTGGYRVCFDPTEQALDPGSPTGDRSGCYHHKASVAVQAGAVRAHIDQQLRVGGAIAGHVTGVGGAPAEDVEVEVLPLSTGLGGGAVTDANGDYQASGLAPGSYLICFFQEDLANLGGTGKCHHGTVDVRVAETTELDASIAPSGPRGSIAVSVRDEDGRRVQGVNVVVLKPCPPPVSLPDEFFCASEPLFGHAGRAKIVDSRMVDNAGRTQSDGRKPGEYAVCLFAYYGVTTAGAPPTGYTDRCAGRIFTVTVQDGATTHVHLTLHPGGRVEGRIVDTSGRPVPHARIHVSNSALASFADPFDDIADLVDDGSPAADAVTHKNGTFSIRGVKPGAQKVCVQAPSSGDYLDRCRDGRVTVTANATTHMHDLALHKAGAIAGVVRDAAGHPLKLVAVGIFTADRHPDLVTVVEVNRHGRYRADGLSTGRYVVCFAAPHRVVECYRQVPWHFKHHPRPPNGTVKVRVTGGHTTTGISAKLPRTK